MHVRSNSHAARMALALHEAPLGPPQMFHHYGDRVSCPFFMVATVGNRA
jgi:hypothetical protein